MSARLVLITAILFAALAPAASAAGGSPVGLLAGMQGVYTPESAARFVAVSIGDNTGLFRILRNGGQVSGYRELDGRLGVPAVAMDGSPGGLSADGSTLVLVEPVRRFPVRKSQLAIVDTRTLHTRRVELSGEWAFDAISPDGRSLYLTEYPFSYDSSRYVVRRYDVKRHRVVGGPIVDKREPDEEMRGSPLTRVSSPRGRWAYTLYNGNDGAPFIHALDTVRRRAFCIDLDALAMYPDPYSLRLRWSGGMVDVVDRDERLVSVEARTLRPLPRYVSWG
jgi:hypothetical protein